LRFVEATVTVLVLLGASAADASAAAHATCDRSPLASI